MGERIKSLFLLSFLRRAMTTAGATTRTKEESGTMSGLSQVCGYDDNNDNKYKNDNYDYHIATICNGGILVVLFPDDAKMVTFWGRKLESGNKMHNILKPKLSWGYRWCQCNAA